LESAAFTLSLLPSHEKQASPSLYLQKEYAELVRKIQIVFCYIIIEVCSMKRYECIQLNHHKDIGKTIEDWEAKGWSFRDYEAVGTSTMVNHYLLFEKESSEAKETRFTESTTRI
jgi:hypothetical protein